MRTKEDDLLTECRTIRIEEDGLLIESDKNIIKDIEGIRCACGDSVLSITKVNDNPDGYTAVYKCKCGNVITVTTYGGDDSMWLWT